MKTKLSLVLSVLVVTLTACTQKDEPVKNSAAENPVSKEAVQKTKEATAPVTNDAAKQVTEPVKAVQKPATVAPTAAKVTTEQALSETIDHAQAVTKTQKSEARQRGQKAVDDMMMEVEKSK